MSGLFGGSSKSQSTSPADTLNIQTSSYSVPIKIVLGTNRITGNLIWYGDFRAVQQSSSGGGGKGGGGGGGGKGSSGGGSYNYYASYIIGLCEGPISGIGTVWQSKTVTNVASLGGAFFNGAAGQDPWGFLQSNHSTQALGYSNLAYVGFANGSLGSTPDTPNYAFEVHGQLMSAGQDAYAQDCVGFLLDAAKFPVTYKGDFSNAANYWKAAGFFISPILEEQRTAADYLAEWMTTLNAEFVWNGSALNIVPYCDTIISGNGVTYTPNLQPIYDLGDDDFIRDGDEDPVTVTRSDMADAYNQQPLEYHDRTNSYNVATTTPDDPGAIDLYGIRTASTVTAHHVTDGAMADAMARNILYRGLYVRTNHAFRLDWRYILLDPMDIVSLNRPIIDLNHEPVRIVDVEEDENGLLSFTTEEMPGDISSPALYSTQPTTAFAPNLNEETGGTNAPVLFEAPLAIVQSAAVELWMGISGVDPFGGCEIWVSTDDQSYTFLDDFKGCARQGVLTAALPASSDSPDTANVLSVDLTQSAGVISGATNDDATNLNSLCYVDGELLAFGASALTGANKYDLSWLVRGAYGSAVSAHASGSQFVRLDNQVYKMAVDQSRIGQKIYVKLVGYNYFGGGKQDIAEVQSYSITITGAALLTPLPNPSGLTVNYRDKIAHLNWTGVSDIRSPIYWEIRKGASFANGQVITRTATTSTPIQGSGTYWVSALYFTPLGVAVYSGTPQSVTVDIPSLVDNLLQDYDENALGWTGTCSDGAAINGGLLILSGAGNVLSSPNILAETSILYLGGVAASGVYTPPDVHTLASSHLVTAKINVSWNVYPVSTVDNILTQPDVLSLDDILGQRFAAKVYAKPQVRLSVDGSTWGDWLDWQPGSYSFVKAQVRLCVYSADSTVQAIVDKFEFSADTPSDTQTGTSTSSASTDVSVAYPYVFNDAPAPQITINGGQANDDLILLTQTEAGFSYKILNSGVRVVRAINWSATSF